MTAAPAAPPTQDLLGREAGPGLPRRTHAIAAGLLVVVVGGFAADQRLQERELDGLLQRAAEGHASMVYADRRIAGLVNYVSPQLFAASTEPAVRTSLAQVVKDAAHDGAQDLRQDRARTVRLEILPWHGAQVRARQAYLAYLDARLGYLDAVSDHLSELYTPQPELAARLAAARSALLAAGPADAQRVATELSDTAGL